MNDLTKVNIITSSHRDSSEGQCLFGDKILQNYTLRLFDELDIQTNKMGRFNES